MYENSRKDLVTQKKQMGIYQITIKVYIVKGIFQLYLCLRSLVATPRHLLHFP